MYDMPTPPGTQSRIKSKPEMRKASSFSQHTNLARHNTASKPSKAIVTLRLPGFSRYAWYGWAGTRGSGLGEGSPGVSALYLHSSPSFTSHRAQKRGAGRCSYVREIISSTRTSCCCDSHHAATETSMYSPTAPDLSTNKSTNDLSIVVFRLWVALSQASQVLHLGTFLTHCACHMQEGSWIHILKLCMPIPSVQLRWRATMQMRLDGHRTETVRPELAVVSESIELACPACVAPSLPAAYLVHLIFRSWT
ncbi:hypothetical protein V8E51_005034 [Hyaloscypha variabilis]